MKHRGRVKREKDSSHQSVSLAPSQVLVHHGVNRHGVSCLGANCHGGAKCYGGLLWSKPFKGEVGSSMRVSIRKRLVLGHPCQHTMNLGQKQLHLPKQNTGSLSLVLLREESRWESKSGWCDRRERNVVVRVSHCSKGESP